MALYNAEAIVIRSRDFNEADKVVVLLTREEGKVEAVARGARRPRSRLAASMQLFTHVKGAFFSGRGLHTVNQVEIEESFRNMREDLVRMAYGTYCCELMDEMVKEKQRYEYTFLLLLTTLHLLNAPDMEPEPILRAYELKLLSMLGYRPSFDQCVVCGRKEMEATHARFAPGLGGILCPTCPSEGEPVQRISRGTMAIMKRLMEGDLRKAHIIRVGAEMAGEMDRALTAYIGHFTEKKLKSKAFLDSLRMMPPTV